MVENFSYQMSEKGGLAVMSFTLYGTKELWRPLFEQAVTNEFGDQIKKDVSKIIDALPDNFPEAISNNLEFGRVIRGLEEIPTIIAGTELIAKRLKVVIDDEEKELVIIGEEHTASEHGSHAVKRIIPYFKLAGTEGVDVEDFWEGRFFFWLIHNIVYPAINLVCSFKRLSDKNRSGLDLLQELSKTSAEILEDSPYKDVKVVQLEEGWSPSWRTRMFFFSILALMIYWPIDSYSSGVEYYQQSGGSGLFVYIAITFLSFQIKRFPLLWNAFQTVFNFILNTIFDLGSSRERNMAKNIVKAFKNNQETNIMMIEIGKAHMPRLTKILQKQHGFVVMEF